MNLPIPQQFVPNYTVLVMGGNNRWAQQRGLRRTGGHKRGEAALAECADACLKMGVKHLSAYASSAENWHRSVDEVRFLIDFNRDMLCRCRDELDSKNVRVCWAGRRPQLWRLMIKELEIVEEQTKDSDALTLYTCVNYSGRAEIVDATRETARQAIAGELSEYDLTEKSFVQFLDEPTMPDVDLSSCPSGEQRTSNFLIWRPAYAEMVYQDKPLLDFGRDDMHVAAVEYVKRDRRFGKA